MLAQAILLIFWFDCQSVIMSSSSLTLRNTFMTLDNQWAKDVSQKRAKSAESYRDMHAKLAKEDESRLVALSVEFDAVDSTAIMMAHFGRTFPTDIVKMDCAGGSGGSVGNVGHPEFCKAPCLKVDCQGGSACRYCHLPHSTKRPAHLSRTQWQMLDVTAPSVWLPTFVCVLKKKVLVLDGSGKMQALLDDLIAGCQPGNADRASPDLRILLLTLRSMRLQSVLSALVRSMAIHGVDVAALHDALVQHYIVAISATSASH